MSRRRLAQRALSVVLATLALLQGCAHQSASTAASAGPPLMPALRSALEAPSPAAAASARPASAALAMPSATVARDELAQATRSDRRFSLSLNNATPEVVFMALLNETPLSVAVDPAVKGPISIALKDVTLREALELLREMRGLDYKVIGRHIVVLPASLQTRMFQVSYPSFNRTGRSDLRVVSGSITGTPGGGGSGNSSSAGSGGPSSSTAGSAGSAGGSAESSHVTTLQRSDLWLELDSTIKLLIGDKDGRSVVVSPQTGHIVVRAFPRELRDVAAYLESTRLAVERQVMLEAKIVDVQLNESERAGINWGAFKAGLSTRISGGVVGPGAGLATSGSIGGGLVDVLPGETLRSLAGGANAVLGLAFQTSNFAAVLEFLSTQGRTQVLSSPRIATVNNQKAVLKVGTDDFFVTNISTTTTAVGNSTATTPNISVQPFFSGISLDVTPNIDAEGFITLHIHPAVSSVSERTKQLNLGTQGVYSVPLASSDINETDAVVRARDGRIIAIGGLMRQGLASSDSGVPGTEGNGVLRKLLGGQSSSLSEKRELVILLKPTIIDPSLDDGGSRRDALQRLLDWTESQPAPATPATQPAASAATPLPAPSAPSLPSAPIAPPR